MKEKEKEKDKDKEGNADDAASEGASSHNEEFGAFASDMPAQRIGTTTTATQEHSSDSRPSLRKVSFHGGGGEDRQAWNSFRKASMQSLDGMQRSLSRDSEHGDGHRESRSRNMSLATLAVAQNERNKAYMLRQGFNLRELENQREELERFVENEEWANDAGLGLGGWKKACLQTMVTTRKAAHLMLKGVRVWIWLSIFDLVVYSFIGGVNKRNGKRCR